MEAFSQSACAQEMQQYCLPRYQELPQIDIYLDQLITVLHQVLRPLFDDDTERCITPSMINNYAKQGVIPRPLKKKYNRDHIAYLIFIAVTKQVMAIDDIRQLIQIQTATYSLETAYNYLCTEFEHALTAVFHGDTTPEDTASVQTQQTKLVRTAVAAVVHKIYLNKFLKYYAASQEEQP